MLEADSQMGIGPVEAVAGKQAHPAIALACDEPVAVVLDLVNPVGADGRLRRPGRYARFDNAGPLRRRLGTPLHAPKMATPRQAGKGSASIVHPSRTSLTGRASRPRQSGRLLTARHLLNESAD
jgi:hypothetical protein